MWEFMRKLRMAYASDFNNDYNDWLSNRGRRSRHSTAIERDARIKTQFSIDKMMGSKQKTAAKNSSVVPDSEKSIIDSTSSPPNDSLNARTRLQEKEKLGGLNDRLAIYMERVRSLETENARLHIQVRESELIEKSTVRGVEKQYESKISQLRNEFEAISRDKAK
uniref:IF rod domain-containing protein n=1 Tax=Ditylenchus dipsaci TaxID=166011 RepID=A0A915DEX5_9BILA